MNEYDSDRMKDLLSLSHGFETTTNEEEADLILLNTCSIREKAQEKVFHQLGRWKKLKTKNPNLKIGVDAFMLIWDNLKYWKILSVLVRAPFIYSISKITYKLFANYRFKKLSHYQMASRKVI